MAIAAERIGEALNNGERSRPVAPAAGTTFEFAQLEAHVRALAASQNAAYTPAATLPRAFREALRYAQTVSFDIFDTAVVRYVDHPADVFLHLEQHPAFCSHCFAGPIARLRIRAESKARAMVAKLIGSYEVNLLEIYQVFCDLAGLAWEHAPDFVAAEEQIELALCAVNPPLHALYQEARAAGKQVLFVSDTYHTQEFLLRLLQSAGYDATSETLFASSATRKSKQSGELFPVVLATLTLDPGSVLHVGDHPVSDGERAREAGLLSILHPHKACRDELTLLTPEQLRGTAEEHGARAAHSFMRGVVRSTPQAAADAGRAGDFWWRLGYAAAGPLTVGFCQWLRPALERDGIDHAYFMLRDGALLLKVWQALFASDRPPCPATALAASRRAALLPVLELAPAFALPSLLGGIGLRPVREYMERLGINASCFTAEARAAGFTSLDQQIDGRFETQRLVELLLQKRVMNVLLERSRTERAALAAYLEHEGLTACRNVALVDLGWSGTIHKSLHILLQSLAPSTQVTGYYVATFPEAGHSVVPGLQARSYLAHRGEPQQVYHRIVQFLNFFEIVYSSSEGSLLYFDLRADGRAEPVCQPPDKSDAQCRHLEAIHEGAVAFAETYRRRGTPLTLGPLPPEAAAERVFRVILQPTPEEARHLGSTVHCDNLGSASQHVSARLRQTTEPSELIADYERAHWKQGLLAMATPETAALRTLLWLTSIEAAEWAG